MLACTSPERIIAWCPCPAASRIGRRILADQYSALRERFHSNTGQQEGKIGFIVSDCNPREHGQRAYQIAAELCRARYGDAPGLVMTGPSASGFNYLPVRDVGQRVLVISTQSLCLSAALTSRVFWASIVVLTHSWMRGLRAQQRHIDYMLLELFKNAARAVMER